MLIQMLNKTWNLPLVLVENIEFKGKLLINHVSVCLLAVKNVMQTKLGFIVNI